MEVCEEIISYLFIKYDVSISHVTSRKSTAFEWLFLEALIKAQKTEFEDKNIEDFFRNYFQIDNPQKLIFPVLKKLYDLQAISCEKLTDDTELSELILKDVKVLPLGKEMQQKGLLPGEHSNDKIDVVFDVSQNKLIWETKKLSSDAQGNYVQIEESTFPERLVREYIESQRPKKKNKSKQKIDWIKDNTEIDSVEPVKKEICFDNIRRKVHLKDGLVWKIESNKIEELEEASLENFENLAPECLSNIPMTAITKPDEEIEQIVLFSKLTDRINLYMKNDSYKTVIIENSFFDGNILNKNISGKGNENNKNDKKDYKTVILSSANQFSVSSKNNSLIIQIPEKLLPQNSILMTKNFPLNVERFSVHAGDFQKEIPFAYLPKTPKHDFKNIIRNAVQKYCNQDAGVLLLLNEDNDLKEDFKTCFNKIISTGSLKDKSDKINAINKLATDLTGRKYISDEEVLRIMIDEDKIKSSVSDLSSARRIIAEYTEISCVRNEVLRNLLKLVLENVLPSDHLEEIWELFNFIKQKSQDSIGFLDKQHILGKLYTNAAKENVAKEAFSGQLKLAHCDLEERSVKLYRIYQDIEEKQKVANPRLKDTFNTWKVSLENFRKYYGTVHKIEEFNNIVEQIKVRVTTARNLNGKNK